MTSLQLAGWALKELIRHPLFFITLTISHCLIFLAASTGFTSMGQHRKLIIDASLSITLIIGFLIIVFSGKIFSSNSRSLQLHTTVTSIAQQQIARFNGILIALFIFTCSNAASCLLCLTPYHEKFTISFKLPMLGISLLLTCCLIAGILNFYLNYSFPMCATILIVSLQLPLLLVTEFNKSFHSLDFYLALLTVFIAIYFALIIFGSIHGIISSFFKFTISFILTNIVTFAGLFFSHQFTLLPKWEYFWLSDLINSTKKLYSVPYISLLLYTFTFVMLFFITSSLSSRLKEPARSL